MQALVHLRGRKAWWRVCTWLLNNAVCKLCGWSDISLTGAFSPPSLLQFREADSAERAMANLNGLELAGRAMKINHVTPESQGGGGMIPGAMEALDSEDFEGGGIGMTQQGRTQLMAKLAEGHNAGERVLSNAAVCCAGERNDAALVVNQCSIHIHFISSNYWANEGLTPNHPHCHVSILPHHFHFSVILLSVMSINMSLSAGLSVPQVDVPAISSCFMLSNMFDPTNETETGWERDIRDDVLDECNKFGDVLHIHVDTVSPQVGVANTFIPYAWTILLCDLKPRPYRIWAGVESFI